MVQSDPVIPKIILRIKLLINNFNQKIPSGVKINNKQSTPGKKNSFPYILSPIMEPKAIKISSGKCSGSVPWQGKLANAKLEGLMFVLFFNQFEEGKEKEGKEKNRSGE